METDQTVLTLSKSNEEDGFSRNLFRNWRFEENDEFQPNANFPWKKLRYH